MSGFEELLIQVSLCGVLVLFIGASWWVIWSADFVELKVSVRIALTLLAAAILVPLVVLVVVGV